MNIIELLSERRRNPEQNPRQSAVEFLRQYKDNPRAYLHTTNLLKVGIYPKSTSSHDSPAGIYAYRLVDIWENSIERWNSGEYQRGLEFLPYHGGDHLFVLESDIDPDFAANYTDADLQADIQKLQQLYSLSDQRMVQLRRSARTNLNFRDMPAGYLWGMTKALVAGIEHEFDEYTPVNTMRWNHVLRALGYTGFNDPGHGFIHGAEDEQALFLTVKAFRVLDHMQQNQRQSVVNLGDKKYVGGRMPRDLYMGGIPNTLFHNYAPQDFAKVHTWTVGGLSYHDLGAFIRFVPWNGVGIINNLDLGNGEHMSSKTFETLAKLPKNIHIKALSLMSCRTPVLMLRKLPPDIAVEQILISPFAPVHGVDQLPEPLRSKVVVQKYR